MPEWTTPRCGATLNGQQCVFPAGHGGQHALASAPGKRSGSDASRPVLVALVLVGLIILGSMASTPLPATTHLADPYWMTLSCYDLAYEHAVRVDRVLHTLGQVDRTALQEQVDIEDAMKAKKCPTSS